MINSFKSIYNGKKVLVTGHTGFKGAWLTLWLTELGADVAGYALEPPTNPSLFDTLKLADRINHNIADVRDADKLSSIVEQAKPDIVFHLAAQALVRYSYNDPKTTYETNILGTVNLLEAVRKTPGVKAVVNVTSDKCYENKEQMIGYKEDDPMGGYDPYSSSKGCSELVTAAYRKSFFGENGFDKSHDVALATARAGNVIGGGDWADDRIIPDCVRALVKNESIEIRRPKATRPWQHVLEPLSGYLHLAALMYEKPNDYCMGWNFGPLDEDIIEVEEIVKNL